MNALQIFGIIYTTAWIVFFLHMILTSSWLPREIKEMRKREQQQMAAERKQRR